MSDPHLRLAKAEASVEYLRREAIIQLDAAEACEDDEARSRHLAEAGRLHSAMLDAVAAVDVLRLEVPPAQAPSTSTGAAHNAGVQITPNPETKES